MRVKGEPLDWHKIGSIMAPSDITDIVRVGIEEIWNQGALDLADELFACDYVNHGGLIPDLPRGPEAIKISVLLYHLAFPSLFIAVKDLFTEGEMVVLHWAACCTHAPEETAKTALVGVTILRFGGRQIAESWTYWDAGDVSRQFGLVPHGTDRHGSVQA
jgi:hypothetical protein